MKANSRAARFSFRGLFDEIPKGVKGTALVEAPASVWIVTKAEPSARTPAVRLEKQGREVKVKASSLLYSLAA